MNTKLNYDELRQRYRVTQIQHARKRVEHVQQTLCWQQQHMQIQRIAGNPLRERQDAKLFSR